MWFKGLSFLSYTALLVAPTNAASYGRNGVARSGRNIAARRNIPYLHGRQQAWKNETRSSVSTQEPESTLSEPVVIVTSDPNSSTVISTVETSSIIITEEPTSTTAPKVEEPAPTSKVTPPLASSSAVEVPVSSTVEKQPSSTSAVISSTAQIKPTTVLIPSTTATPTSLEPLPTSSAPIATSEPIIPEPQPSTTTALVRTSSTLIPDPVEEPTTTQIPSTSESAPVETPSSTLQPIPSVAEPSSIKITSSSRSTLIPSVIAEPSSQQQVSSTAEQQPSATSVQELPTIPVAEPTATIQPISSTSAQVIISTSEPVLKQSSTALVPVESTISSVVISTSSQILDTPVASTSTGALTTDFPISSVTSGTALLPLPSDILPAPSNLLSSISSLLSSVLLPSNVAVPTSSPVPSVTQTAIDVSDTTALPTSSVPIPSHTGFEVSSTNTQLPTVSSSGVVESLSLSATTIIPVIPTSETAPVISSTDTALPISSQTGPLVSSGLTLSGALPSGSTTTRGIPASETLPLSNAISTQLTQSSDLVPTQTGISFPVSGTGFVSSLVSSSVSLANPTAPIEESNTKAPLTTSSPISSSDLPPLSISFDLFNNSPSPSANGTYVPTSTGIPASETRSVPTTAITGLPSTLSPAPGFTTGISGATNASGIISSGFFGTGTSIQVPITTGEVPTPTQVEVKETSEAPKVAIPTSESATPTLGGGNAAQTPQPSPSGSSLGPSDAPGQPSSTVLPGNGEPVSTTLPGGNGGLVPSPTVPGNAAESKTVPPATSSTTAAAAAAPPAPALSKPQTAAVAVGGTVGVLIALVAALFVVRRYHTNAAAKRQSNGVYPEVAYLYDPQTGGDHDAEAGGGVPAMSGGASGYSALASSAPGYGPYGAAPASSPRNSTASGWPAGSQGPSEPATQNPFKDPVVLPMAAARNVPRHGQTDSTVSAWPTGTNQEPSWRKAVPNSVVFPKSPLGNTPQHGPSESRVSAWPAGNQDRSSQVGITSPVIIPKSSFQNLPQQESEVSAWPHKPMAEAENPFLDPVSHERQLSPRLATHDGSVGDVLDEYMNLAANPYVFNPHAAQYPPMSPYGPTFPAAVAAPAPVRDSDRYSDPFSDPFEHDLLLHVDTTQLRDSSTDSIAVMAPPPTPRSPRNGERYTPEPVASSNGNLMPITRVPVGRSTPSPDGRDTPDTLAPPGRYTPESMQSGQSTLNNTPVMATAQLAQIFPVHKGWDDIKMHNSPSIPEPLNLAPQVKKKPLPLRRQPTLAGAGQVLLQGPGLPLILKRKEVGTHNKDDSTGSGFGLEVPRADYLGSPGPTINEYSSDLHVQRKRSGELMFADPALVGRNF